jgi:hypothetical protein
MMKPDRANSLSNSKKRGKLRLRATLRPRENRAADLPLPSRINRVSLHNESSKLIIQKNRVTLNVTRAMNKEMLNPINQRKTKTIH